MSSDINKQTASIYTTFIGFHLVRKIAFLSLCTAGALEFISGVNKK
jgi:hypothetical protein